MPYSITIPDTPEAIKAAAAFFAGLVKVERPEVNLSEDLIPNEIDTTTLGNREPPEMITDVLGGVSELNPAALFNDSPIPVPPPPPTPPTAVSLPPTSGIKLADGIPWDERIHAGSRAILSAVPNGWKRKPKPPEYATKEEWLAYVEKVEAELRAAVGITPPPVPPVQTGLGWTYASLTEAITRNGFGPETIKGVLARIGLTAYPQLSARPDLIPQVAEFLGLIGV